VDWLTSTFGMKIKDVYRMPDGGIAHCELRFGDSLIMCGEAQGAPRTLAAMFYVKDCDALFAKAVAAGAKVTRPLQDQFYGDRSGTVADPFGNEWTIATHVEDVSKKEMDRRMAAMMSQQSAA
jgi:PhnB protein